MPSNHAIKSFLLMAVCCAAVPAQAAMSFWEEMDTIEAQIELLNKRKELANVLKESASTLTLPAIVSIIEDAKGASAKVAFDSGMVRWVSVGDELADGVRVTRISVAGVQVQAGKTGTWLPFQTAPVGPAGSDPAAAPRSTLSVMGEAPLMAVPPMTPRRITPPAPMAAPSGAAPSPTN